MADQKTKTVLITVVATVRECVDETGMHQSIESAITHADCCKDFDDFEVRKSYETELADELHSVNEELSHWATDEADENDHHQIYINDAHNSAKELLEKIGKK